MGLVARRHVESSCTRDRAGVPHIASWILSHWTTREAPTIHFQMANFKRKIGVKKKGKRKYEI